METGSELDGIFMTLKSVGIPFALALVGSILARVLLKKDGHRSALFAVALFSLCGILGGYAAMNYEHWQFPPTQAMDRLPVLAVLSLIVLLSLELIHTGKRVWLVAQIGLALLGAWLMLPPAIKDGGALQIASYVILPGLIWVALWRHLEAYEGAPRRSGIALTFTAGALGFVVALGGSITIGLTALSLMGALAGWLLVCVVGGWIPLPRALLGSFILWFGSVVIAAYFYAEISPWPLAIVIAGLPSAQLARLAPFIREDQPLREVITSGLATALPLIMAMGFAVWSYLRQANAY